MNRENIRSLNRISRSLWGELNRSFHNSEEALVNASLLHLSEDMTIERASKMMIERAERNPPGTLKLNHPFYRLAPIERFLLTALHIEKWPYERVARTLSIDPSLVESWAWATRLKYSFQELEAQIDYPRGPASLGLVCPEYNAAAPWTQRMLDDELGKRERNFLQGHLMGCEKCRKSLEATRKMFFTIESFVPVKTRGEEMEAAVDKMLDVWEKGESTYRPIKVTAAESFDKLLSRRDVQIVLAIAGFFLLYHFHKT
ncbi:MAG: zf-HC2 domain-containing protein [Bdellovibrionales bacterium]|nr:zf-HC2 domain-containing protein [Bdellovibrionales bacterium]